MSMIYCLQQASDATLKRLHAEPALITAFLGIERPTRKPPGLIGRLLGAKTPPPDPPAAPVTFERSAEVCDLDKAWHGMHFLFTGSDWEGDPPAGFLVNWGDEVGTIDVGYGPARTFTSAQVLEIEAFLAGTAEELLRSRFDQERMMELQIYPTIWDHDPDDDDTLDYVLSFYQELKKYVASAAARGWGLVEWLC
jgi:hypothetical protein